MRIAKYELRQEQRGQAHVYDPKSENNLPNFAHVYIQRDDEDWSRVMLVDNAEGQTFIVRLAINAARSLAYRGETVLVIFSDTSAWPDVYCPHEEGECPA